MKLVADSETRHFFTMSRTLWAMSKKESGR
jgi:hypothetical protein